MAWLNVFRNRARSLSTFLITFIASLAILLMLGFAQYTYHSLKEFTIRQQGHLTISHLSYFNKQEIHSMQYGISQSDSIRQQLLKLPQVKHVFAAVEFNGLIANDERSTIFVGQGVDAEIKKVLGPTLSLQQGHFLSLRPNKNQLPEVLLGSKLASTLSANVGSELTLLVTTGDGALNAIDVQVQGIVSSGIAQMDAHLLMIHTTDAQLVLDTNKVSLLSVHLYDEKNLNILQQLLNRDQQLITPWYDRAEFYHSVKQLYDRIFGMSGIILLSLVLFTVVNSCAMAVLERRNELGTLRAMGVQQYELIWVFTLEIGMIITLAAISAILCTAFISLILPWINWQMPPPPGQTNGYPLQIYFSLLLSAALLFILTVISSSSAMIAVYKSNRLTIKQAMHHA